MPRLTWHWRLRVKECILYQTERISLFIDGANLYATAKSLGFDIDYKAVSPVPPEGPTRSRALLHGARRRSEYSSIRPLIEWLRLQRLHHGDQADEGIHRRLGIAQDQGQHGFELASMHALAENLDTSSIFSGDGDSASLVGALQQMGKRVSVVFHVADPAADGRR